MLEEKQKELDALQSEFDEYIASSREVEEELDAELARCQNDLTKATNDNATLTTQLSQTQSQITTLTDKLTTLTTQLQNETTKRITSERTTSEAESKLRQAEGTLAAIRSTELRKLKEENDELCERLGLLESEAEDCKNELNEVSARYREEVEELQGDVAVLKDRLKETQVELDLLQNEEQENSIEIVVSEKKGEDGAIDPVLDGERSDSSNRQENASGIKKVGGKERGADSPPPPPPPPSVENLGTTTTNHDSNDRKEYIRTLENGLEQATEQLAEVRAKLSQTQSELTEALVLAKQAKTNRIQTNSNSSSSGNITTTIINGEQKIAELETTIKLLRAENTALKEGTDQDEVPKSKPKRHWLEIFSCCVKRRNNGR